MGADPRTLSPEFLAKIQGRKVDVPKMGPVATGTNLIVRPTTDEDRLNKLEKSWLSILRKTHPEQNIGIQSITLKLGDDSRYTPDFWTIDPNGQLIFWETKGWMRDDALVKLKTAARQFRWARFILVNKVKGIFKEEPINP